MAIVLCLTFPFLRGKIRWNHDRFCRGVLSVEEAVVRGRLYELPFAVSWLQCGPLEPFFQLGFMWSGIAAQGGSESYLTASGAQIVSHLQS